MITCQSKHKYDNLLNYFLFTKDMKSSKVQRVFLSFTSASVFVIDSFKNIKENYFKVQCSNIMHMHHTTSEISFSLTIVLHASVFNGLLCLLQEIILCYLENQWDWWHFSTITNEGFVFSGGIRTITLMTFLIWLFVLVKVKKETCIHIMLCIMYNYMHFKFQFFKGTITNVSNFLIYIMCDVKRWKFCWLSHRQLVHVLIYASECSSLYISAMKMVIMAQHNP